MKVNQGFSQEQLQQYESNLKQIGILVKEIEKFEMQYVGNQKKIDRYTKIYKEDLEVFERQNQELLATLQGNNGKQTIIQITKIK